MFGKPKCLRQSYRRPTAAAPQYLTVTAGPASTTRTDREPTLDEVPCSYLGCYRHRRGVGETEVEDFACVVIYRVCAYFYVVDALRPAIKEQPAPSKPVIPILDCPYTIAQMYRKVKKASIQILLYFCVRICALRKPPLIDTPDPQMYTRRWSQSL